VRPLILLLAAALFAQCVAAQTFWAKKQSGANTDESLAIASDAAGNSYSTGYFSTSATINETNLSVQGLTDVYVSKVSSNGTSQWSKSFGGSQSDRGLGISVDLSGNVLVCGFYTGSINFGNGVSLASNGGQDAFVVKLDANGNAIWAKTGGSTEGSDRANALAVDATGNVFVTGQFSGSASFGAFTLDATDGTNDAFIVKYDSNGNEQWAKQGSGEALDRGLGITTDNSGAAYVTGQFSGNVSFDNSYTNTIQNAIFLVKYSSIGNEEWFRWGGGSEESISYDITSDGNSVFLTGDYGTTLNFFGTGSTVTLTSGFANSIFLMSFSTNGNFSWGESAGSESNVSSRGINFSFGNIAIAGWFECTFDSYSDEYGEAAFNSLGSADSFTAMYSASGSFQWARNFGSTGDERCNSITVLPDGFVALAGTNGDSGLIVPVTDAPIDGMSADLIQNENTGLNYCGDPNYGNYRTLIGTGGLDGFVLKAIDPARSPMDFYQRSGGGCDLSVPNACIFRNSTSTVPEPCPESLIGCSPYSVTASNYTLSGIGFSTNYQWSFSGSTGVISLVTAASTENVTITSQDGCYSATDDIELEVYAEPDIPLITDSEGINNLASTPSPIILCPGESVMIEAEIGSDYSFQWFSQAFGPVPVLTQEITATEQGLYTISVTSPDGCTKSNQVNVVYFNVPEDVPPLISTQANNDTLKVCDGELFPVQLLNELDSEPYPPEQYSFEWSVSPGVVETGTNSVSVQPTTSGWIQISVELTSQINPCVDTIYTQFASDSVYIDIVPIPEVFIELEGPEFYCPDDTLVFTLDFEGNLLLDFTPLENFGDSLYIVGPGLYEVSVDATNEFGCFAEAFDFLSVSEVTTPEIFTSPTEAVVCPGDSVEVSTNSSGSITWQGPAGTFQGESSIFVQDPGLYFAEVEFYDGCALVSNTVEVSEFATPFLDGSNAVLCPGGEVEIGIVSSDLDNIEWQAPFSGGDTVQTVTEPGTYSVVVTGCNVDIELFIEVELTEYDLGIAIVNPEPTCDGDSILISATPDLESYQWLPDGSGEEEWFTESGTVSVVGVDEYGCELSSNQIEIDFEDIPPLPEFDFSSVCQGEPVTLEVVTDFGVNFLESANGEIISNENSVFISALVADTTYYVYLNSANCNGPIDSITIGPKPFPEVPIIASNAPVCTGSSISLEVLNSANGVIYSWLTPYGEVLQGEVVSYGVSALDQEGEYFAFADLEDCISDTVGIDISLFETRRVNLPPDTALCFRPGFTIAPDTIFNTYLWMDNSTDSIFRAGPEDSGLVRLTTTDFNGCRSEDIMNLSFVDCSIQIPNVITPNGDGLNDEWIIGLEQPLFFNVVIYNRWGRVVYESNDFSNFWDGTHYKTEKLCSEGVYFYIIRINDFEGRAFEKQGDLTLFRD